MIWKQILNSISLIARFSHFYGIHDRNYALFKNTLKRAKKHLKWRIKIDLNNLHKKLTKLEQKIENFKDDLQKNVTLKNQWYDRFEAAGKGRLLIQKVAEDTQNKITFYISDLVTSCIKSIPFDEEYEFKLEFEQSRGQTEGNLFFVTKDGEKLKPVDSSGGGICDITSIGNMISFWCLKPNRNLMIWDEPTKHLSEEYSEAAGEMIRILCEEKGIQVLMVTHDKILAKSANNLIELSHD